MYLLQVTKVNDDLKKKIDDLQTEMKKFKAVFLKQENRIRGLEGKLAALNTSGSGAGSDVPADSSAISAADVSCGAG